MSSPTKAGSLLGGILLIAGSCIGAGMLAIRVVTGVGGFVPSIAIFLFTWLFMSTTGLLLLEANLTLGYDLSLISLAEKTLGSVGKGGCWLLFLFLFYSLNIAYIAASGVVLQTVGLDLLGLELPVWFGSALFTLLFGVVIYVGTKPVDYLNRLLMLGLIIAYFVLVFLGSQYIQPHLLTHSLWIYSFAAIPVMIISFGFHNMIPSMAMYLKGDVKRLRLVIIVGSSIPLVVYLLWQAVMLGIIPSGGKGGLLEALRAGLPATEALRAVVGKSWISTIAQLFTLFAITTSFLAQSLSLVDFLADGLKIPKVKMGRAWLVLLTLLPPFVLAFIYPGIFIQALNIAGGFSAVLLFGVMPALMVWVLRYRKKTTMSPIMPTGRFLLIVVLVVAVCIFALEAAQEMGLSLLPSEMELIP